MTALRATVDRIARALLAPGPAGRRRILTLWYGGTALMALLLAALGLLAVGLIEQAATEQFVRLGDDADQGPAFAAARQAERLLRPLLALQAERVEDELLQVTSPQALAQLFAETPDAVRLAAVTRLRTDSELVVTRRGSGWQVTERWSSPLPAAAAPEWYAAAPGPRWCAQYQHSDSGPLVLAFISGSQLAELTVAEAAARWLQVEGLAAA
ncbi:MAG TPA: hypothetical protein PKM88_01370, partial [bacterium]|nr:hypothetical protein [bacterium]